jgi:nicotinate dehydrogenase subunit B
MTAALPLPWSLRQNPRLGQWVSFPNQGIARVFTAKVELGQGILTAMAQIAAEELHLPLAQIEVVSGDTRFSPDESYTAGSMSIEIGGTSLRLACAQARHAIRESAAARLGVDAARLGVERGAILLDGKESGLDYWKLAPDIDWNQTVTGEVDLSEPGAAAYIGKNLARVDLPPKVTGAGFVQDLELPAMLHGRVLRPPTPDAHLISLDRSRAEALPGIVKIWVSGDFVGVVCEREFQAIKTLEALGAGAKWAGDEGFAIDQDWKRSLPRLRSIDSHSEHGEAGAIPAGAKRLSATYSKPPLAHASMGPSCAVASFEGGALKVWSHTQGVFPLRAALAKALRIDEQQVTVMHTPGAGCYGHNGADDVALDAALLAREVAPRPVRIQWMRGDELAWSPFSSPMVIKIAGAVMPDGKIADWSTEIWSGPHGRRPNRHGVELLAATHIDPPIPFPEVHEDMAIFAGGARNSEPAYDVRHRRIELHSLPGLPFRTSALRTLGGYANVFAVESFMDEMADAIGIDPIELRLRNLSDLRARRVIETAAEMSRWDPKAPRGTGRAAGIGFCRYKTTAAYVAVVAYVDVGEQVRVTKVHCAVDAGLAINPDGIVNQIEGGIIQAISWTLKEQAAFGPAGVTTRSWDEYPILRFDEVPQVEVRLIDNPDLPPLGVGEASCGPAGAAVANAVARALDRRVRDLPLTREQIIAAMA